MTTTFERKGVYHSELVRETDPDGLEITLDGKPQKSKDGDSYYVYFKHQGKDHYYTIENLEIKEYLENCVTKVPVMIHAFGTREGATIVIEELDKVRYPGGIPSPGPGPAQEEVKLGAEAMSPETTPQQPPDSLYLTCLLQARAAHKEFTKRTGTPLSDDDIRIATTMYIAANRQ